LRREAETAGTKLRVPVGTPRVLRLVRHDASVSVTEGAERFRRALRQ
jgi:hypothetical protein